ncbi:MAG: DUF1674 domain-containing protein [Pseudomonadota bacterium]
MNASNKETPRENQAHSAEKKLTLEAKRALKEAEQRRQTQNQKQAPTEIGGQKGPDPARYGDWEKDGIISDF